MKDKPGIYWNGKSLEFGFWVLQRSGKLYFSGTPVNLGVWTYAQPQDTKGLHFLCDLEGQTDEEERTH